MKIKEYRENEKEDPIQMARDEKEKERKYRSKVQWLLAVVP